ncbi:MAG: hypothetical protein B9S32_03200 [Verrucomicrobia bacterium Tous-C9LFEB]|nr:MAG: hypothetical protein B9S32_03200 [Verrucomicrobia bacterium Tous-C9LFEB]
MTSYNEKQDEPKAIDVEIVSESPAPAKSEPAPKVVTFFHPLSGLTILLIDWLSFGLDVPTGFLLTALFSVGAFITTFAGVYWIQRRESNDSQQRALFKALFGGLAAGVPFPITGTIVGTGILILSGLPFLTKK